MGLSWRRSEQVESAAERWSGGERRDGRTEHVEVVRGGGGIVGVVVLLWTVGGEGGCGRGEGGGLLRKPCLSEDRETYGRLDAEDLRSSKARHRDLREGGAAKAGQTQALAASWVHS
jgi:hypothetical protein